MGKQRDFRRDAEAPHLFDRQFGHFDEFLGGWIGRHMGIAQEDRSLGQDDDAERRDVAAPLLEADHVSDVAQVPGVLPIGPAQHRVDLAAA